MEHFFLHCGDFYGHQTFSDGESPNRSWSVYFYYQHGVATYAGREWKFTLFTEVE